jgi:hypothetical protein
MTTSDPRTPAEQGIPPRFTFDELRTIVDVEREAHVIRATDMRLRAAEQVTPAETADWNASADDRARRAAGLAKVIELVDWCGDDPEIKARLGVLARDKAERVAAIDKASDGDVRE